MSRRRSREPAFENARDTASTQMPTTSLWRGRSGAHKRDLSDLVQW